MIVDVVKTKKETENEMMESIDKHSRLLWNLLHIP